MQFHYILSLLRYIYPLKRFGSQYQKFRRGFFCLHLLELMLRFSPYRNGQMHVTQCEVIIMIKSAENNFLGVLKEYTLKPKFTKITLKELHLHPPT